MMVFLVALGWWFMEVDSKQSAGELASVIEDVRWVLDKVKAGIDDGVVIDMLVRRGGLPKRGAEEGIDKGRAVKKR